MTSPSLTTRTGTTMMLDTAEDTDIIDHYNEHHNGYTHIKHQQQQRCKTKNELVSRNNRQSNLLKELANRMGDCPFVYVRTKDMGPYKHGYASSNGQASKTYSRTYSSPNIIDARPFLSNLPVELQPTVAFAFLIFEYRGMKQLYPMRKLKIVIGRRRKVENRNRNSIASPSSKSLVTNDEFAADHYNIDNLCHANDRSNRNDNVKQNPQIGRSSSTQLLTVPQHQEKSDKEEQNHEHEEEQDFIDVRINVTHSISRKNTEIEYDLSKKRFVLHSFGKFDTKVDGKSFPSGARNIPLKDRSDIWLGSRVRIKFLLPNSI